MTGTSVADLIRDEAAVIDCGLRLQRQGLDLLLAEMRALAGILPALHPAPYPGAAPWTEDDAEACFDNMPV
jgi:hypothetical protein